MAKARKLMVEARSGTDKVLPGRICSIDRQGLDVLLKDDAGRGQLFPRFDSSTTQFPLIILNHPFRFDICINVPMNATLPSLPLKLAGSIPLRIAHVRRQASWHPTTTQCISNQSRRFFSKTRWRDSQSRLPPSQACMVHRRVRRIVLFQTLPLTCPDVSLLHSPIRAVGSIQGVGRIKRCASSGYQKGLLWVG
jgi:hypothetical protein